MFWIPPVLLLIYSGLFGAMVGSFCNVAIYRIPRRCRSVSRPLRSFCPGCMQTIAWYDNLPVLSWLALRARCRNCKMPISIRYPLVEALVAGLWVLIAWRTAWLDPQPLPRMLCLQILASILVVVSLIDIDWKIIPDRIDLPGIVLAPVVACLVPGFVEPLQSAGTLLGVSHPAVLRLLGSLAGAATGAGSLYLVAVIGAWAFKREAMGMGDVKLMGMLGGLLGWQPVLLAIAGACFLGTFFGLALKLTRKTSLMPFGPHLCAASFWLMLFGDETWAFLLRAWDARQQDPLGFNLGALAVCLVLLLILWIMRRRPE